MGQSEEIIFQVEGGANAESPKVEVSLVCLNILDEGIEEKDLEDEDGARGRNWTM